jgi:hypothetical protein
VLTEPQLIDVDENDRAVVTIGEYLAGWGCDPCYTHPPQRPGDGYVFYNYCAEGDRLSYLKDQLLPALGRLLEDTTLKAADRDNLETIRRYITEKIALLELEKEAPPILKESETFETPNGVRITYAAVRQAMKGETYTMRLRGRDYQAVVAAVNKGIDSRLQACYMPDRGDSMHRTGMHVKAVFSRDSLPVLVRRLFEAGHAGDYASLDLAEVILTVLGFDEAGRWRDRSL